MKRFIPTISLLLLAAFAFAGCETSGQNALLGAATGAAIGGALPVFAMSSSVIRMSFFHMEKIARQHFTHLSEGVPKFKKSCHPERSSVRAQAGRNAVEGPRRFVPAQYVNEPPGSLDSATPAFPPALRSG